MLTAAELRAAWLVACEMFLDLEMSDCSIFDLSQFSPDCDNVASLDRAGKLHCYPIRKYGRFRLAYDDNSNMLYVGRA